MNWKHLIAITSLALAGCEKPKPVGGYMHATNIYHATSISSWTRIDLKTRDPECWVVSTFMEQHALKKVIPGYTRWKVPREFYDALPEPPFWFYADEKGNIGWRPLTREEAGQ